jgi:two-component system response regulator AtoC
MATDSGPTHHLVEKVNSSHFFTSLPEEKRTLLLLQKVQKAMHNVPDFVETCKAILDAVIEETHADNCSLMLRDLISGDLCICAAKGRKDENSTYYMIPPRHGKRFKPGEGVAGWVFKEGQALVLNDVVKEPRFAEIAGFNNSVRSLICFPVREKDQIVGVFNISHSEKGAFDDEDKIALAYASYQVGAALTSALLFFEIQEVDRLMRNFGKCPPRRKEILDYSHFSSLPVKAEEKREENGVFIYASEKMHQIKAIMDQVANTDVTVLIQGESGVGKEVVARSIHLSSSRVQKPFVKVNCAAITHELLESELFGYEKGAFTGAYRQKPGKFELAHRGTMFLDEIVEMDPALQAKLLQVLQDREFSRIGGEGDIRVDVRVLAATNKDVEEAIAKGQFREDLYYRLNVVSITIPPLRERKEEIPFFVEHFLSKFRRKYNKKVKPISERLLGMFLRYDWPGNIRELENLVHRYVVLNDEETVVEEFTPVMKNSSFNEKKDGIPKRKVWPSLKEVHREATVKMEAEIIRQALDTTNWNRKKAGCLLNISYKTLLYKMRRCGIRNK